MTKFKNGPAAGTVLDLERAPRLLRAVRSRGGKWDALDQLDDQPQKTETIVVYRLVKLGNPYHILYCRSGSGRRGRWLQDAEYELYDPQPDDATLRGTNRWREWCQAQPIAQRETA